MKKLIIIFLLLIPCASWAASSRVLPTAYTEHTYDSAGGGEDYTSLATWEADTDTDLVTATSGYVLTCSSGVHNDRVAMDGATTSADYFRVIRGADGQRGTRTSGARFEYSGTASGTTSEFLIFNLDENYASCFDIAVGATAVSGNARYCFISQATAVKTIGCTAYGAGSIGRVEGFCAYYGSIIVANCFGTNFGSNTYSSGVWSSINGTVTVYNSTFTNSRNGLYSYYGTLTSKNCVLMNNTYATAGAVSQTTNATSGVTFAADGYHLASNDTGAIGAGTDLSADGTFAFDDDIDGETRSDWDIGADEYAAPSTGRRRIIMVQ